MDGTRIEGRMPPRAKSAVPVRDRGSFASMPSRDEPPRPKLLRRASMAALPKANSETTTPVRPALRRGSTFVSRRSAQPPGLNGAPNTRPPPRPRPIDNSVTAIHHPPLTEQEEPPAICGMCGNCGEGARAMPPWAPERLSKMSADERRRVLLQFREREETGKISSAVRAKTLKNAQAKAADKRATGISPMPAQRPRRGPAKNPLTALAKAESFRRLMSEESVDLDAQRARTLPPGIGRSDSHDSRDSRVSALGAVPLDSIDLGDDLGNEVEAFRNDGSTRRRARVDAGTPASELEKFGDDGGDADSTNPDIQRSIVIDSFSADVYAAEESVLDIDCAQCDDLEARVRDLEEQLGVLREVVKISEEGNDKRESDVDSISADDHTHPKKNKSWKDRVLGGYFGANNTVGERTRLKQEVDALRKATNFLFSKLQESDEKRTRNKKA